MDKPIYTSNEIDIPGHSGQNSYELNVRSVMVFREIGQGLKSMTIFTINMAEPINTKAYNAINDCLLEASLMAAK